MSQNLYLAATERGLGASLVAGFDDTRPRALTHKLGTATAAEHPLAILAIGARRE